MKTIKNYLESMFAKLPNTPEVKKAKDELWQMMEDKYNELIAEGMSDNAAVGTVISEFGNLDACVIIGLNQRKPYKSRVAGLSPIILDRKIGTLTLPDDYLCSAA